MPTRPTQRAASSSAFMQKYGLRLKQAHEEHKNDETEFGTGGQLPPGINGGVAQLVECKVDQYKKGSNQGDWYWYAAGVCIEPVEHNGIRCEGLRTSIMEPLCDTPTRSRPTFKEHLAWVYNELRKLGINTSTMRGDDLEVVMQALKDAAPYFRFRTWQGDPTPEFPNPRVNHDWQGATDYTPATSNGVDDQTAAMPPASVDRVDRARPGKSSNGATRQASAADEFQDLDSLARRAQQGDEAAQEALLEHAERAGYEREEILGDANSTWLDVVKMIESATSNTEEEEEPEAAPAAGGGWQPAVGEHYSLTPTDAKGRPGKPVEVTVVTVDQAARTCTLRNVKNPKLTYKGIDWDTLTAAE